MHAGIPAKNTVVLVDGSNSGSGLVPSSDAVDFWWNDTLGIPGPSLIGFKADMDASGFVPNAMIWSQGETDANFIPGTTPRAVYKTSLKAVFDNIRETYTNMPISIQPIGRKTSAHSNTGGVQEVRDIQFEVIAENSFVHRGPDSFDQTLFDGLHLIDAGYEVMGTRHGNRILDLFGFTVASAIGPHVLSVTRSGTTVTVELLHDSGTDFTPVTAISGFAFFDDSTEITISAAVRTDFQTITLTLASTPTGTEILYYIHDTAASVTVLNLVQDNATLSMPLQSVKSPLPFLATLESELDLPSVVFFYDGSDDDSFTVVDGKATQWNDQTSNANNLTESSNPPIRGSDHVQFTGTELLTAPDDNSLDFGLSYTVFFVMENNTTGDQYFLTKGQGDGFVFFGRSSGILRFGIYDSIGLQLFSTADVGTSQQIISFANVTGGTTVVRSNGTQLVSSTNTRIDNPSNTKVLSMGALNGGSSRWKGKMYDCLGANTLLTDAQQNALGTKWALKHGLTWNSF